MSAAALPHPSSPAGVLRRLLRAPADIATSCREDRDTRAIVAVSLAAVLVGSTVFGGTIGSFRGGVQIPYAAVKLPLAMLATLALSAPAFHALAAGLGRAWPMRSVVALALAAAGRSALVLLAVSPVLWLLYDLGLGYHAASLAAALAYAVAGLAALGVVLRGLGEGAGQKLTALAFAGVFFAVGGQTSWILRPYLVRPRTDHIPFVRAREGGFLDAIHKSTRSAAGVYDVDASDVAPSRAVPIAVPAEPAEVDPSLREEGSK
jgi:hypothetical protein